MLDSSSVAQASLEIRFAQVWQSLTRDQIDTLDAIYHPEVHFVDPSGELHGRDALKRHLRALYENVISCQFRLSPTLGQSPAWAQPWHMELRHPKLANAKPILVKGISQLHSQNGLIIYHQDYFDLGAMLYEHVSVIGVATRWLKSRVAP